MESKSPREKGICERSALDSFVTKEQQIGLCQRVITFCCKTSKTIEKMWSQDALMSLCMFGINQVVEQIQMHSTDTLIDNIIQNKRQDSREDIN